MATTRKQYSPKFKARVAVEAIRGEKTLSQLKVHPIQIAKWRKAALDQLPELFVDGRTRKASDEADNDALYEAIGRLKVKLDWLKKQSACSTEQMRALVAWDHPEISIWRQCELLGVNRSGLYYEPAGESEENLLLMRLLDEQYTRTPFYGSRKMTEWLVRQGYAVNRKRISRRMGVMGLETVYPKPKLSRPGDGHRIYPYLLRDVAVERVNQVWSTDITHIRMAQGFVYLVAVMDWFSRFVLSWALSVASYILGRVSRALSDDWERMYGHAVCFAETFIDPGRFRGTCYRAANWQLLGLTTGRGKNDQTNKPNRPIKEVLGLPLTRRFREYLSQL